MYVDIKVVAWQRIFIHDDAAVTTEQVAKMMEQDPTGDVLFDDDGTIANHMEWVDGAERLYRDKYGNPEWEIYDPDITSAVITSREYLIKK